MQAPTVAPLQEIKARQKAMWASGDFSVIGTTLQVVGETLCEAADLRAGSRVLDVACGNGNASLAAARRFCDVVGVDYVPALVERARVRAAGERLDVAFHEGDAEALPFEDGSFDAVLSTFGVMFAPDQARAAAELARVCRPGGVIALANWTPEGFIGELFKVVGRHVPPPPGLRSPAYWGTPEGLRELFGGAVTEIGSTRRHFVFRYKSAAHWIDVFRRWYGPVHRAFAMLDADGQAALDRDLHALLARYDQSGGTSLVVPGEYLEVVVRR
jgi:SAM-dependent methyltransferase